MSTLPSDGAQIDCDYKECGNNHPNWRHAESLEEIAAVLAEYGSTFDEDGDQVVKMEREGAGIATIVYHSVGRDRDMDYKISTDPNSEEVLVGYVMIPLDDVTDEDVEAAIRSILGAS